MYPDGARSCFGRRQGELGSAACFVRVLLGLAVCLPFRLLQLPGLSYFPPACHFQFTIRLRCLDALLVPCSFLCVHEKPTVLLVRRLLLYRLSIHLTTPTLRFLPSQFNPSCCCNLSISRYLHRPNRQVLLPSSYLITLAASNLPGD